MGTPQPTVDRRADSPRIAVILPTHNRRHSLARVLDGYRRQTLPTKDWELIIIDDGSTDDTGDYLRQQADSLGFALVAERQPQAGPARARNRALELNRAPVVLFTGDDIIPSPQLLERHLGAHGEAASRQTAVVGKVIQMRGTTPPALRSFLDRHDYEFGYHALDRGAAPDYRYFYTCNLSLNADWLGELGARFDEDFGHAAWEDIELAYRLTPFGLTMRYEPQALAEHHHYYRLGDVVRRVERVGEMACVLIAKHPALDGVVSPVSKALAEPPRSRLQRTLLQCLARVGTGLYPVLPGLVEKQLDRVLHRILADAYRDGVGRAR